MSTEAPSLLLVEDDPILQQFLAENLTADGYELTVAETVRDGLRELEHRQPDLAIVDLGLPDGSGLDLIARVRAADGPRGSTRRPRSPIVLTGASEELIGSARSSAGSTTTSSSRSRTPELPAMRGRRRAAPFARPAARGAPAGRRPVVDPASREVRLRGRRIDLSQKEFALLRHSRPSRRGS